MIESDKIGTEVEAFCNKCKENSIHTITSIKLGAIDKVICNGCLSTHKYKPPEGEEPTLDSFDENLERHTEKKPRAPKKSRSKAVSVTLSNVDKNSAVNYTLDNNYEVNTVINHSRFGIGIVQKILTAQKIQVLFEDGQRLLVQNWSEGKK